MKQSMIVLLVMAATATTGCSTLLGDPHGGEMTLVSSSHPNSEYAKQLPRDLERRWTGQRMRDEMASREVVNSSDASTDVPSEEYTVEEQEFIDTLNQLVAAGGLTEAKRDIHWDNMARTKPELREKFLQSLTAGLKHQLKKIAPSKATSELSSSTDDAPKQAAADTKPATQGLVFKPAAATDPPSLLKIAKTAASTPAAAPVERAAEPTAKAPPVRQRQSGEVKQASYVEAAPKDAPPPRNDRVVSSRDDDPQRWQDHVLLAVAALERQRRTAPGETIDTELETQVRLLQLAVGRKEEALADLPQNRAMSAAERRAHQEFLQAVVAGLDEYMRHDRDEFEPAEANLAKATRQFRQAADRLGQLATLDVKNVTLCRKVDDFGVVEPFVSKTFRSEQEVMLYAEVENFVSELAQQSGQISMYRTALKSSYRVFDSEGREVGKGSAFKTIKDLCRSYRRDFFVAYRIYLPKHMYDGTHTLTLTIEDTLGQKIGQGSVQLEVAAGSKSAAIKR